MKKLLFAITFLPLFAFGQNWTEAMTDSSSVDLNYSAVDGWTARLGTYPDSVCAFRSGAWFAISGQEGTAYSVLRATARDTVKQYAYTLKPEEVVIITE